MDYIYSTSVVSTPVKQIEGFTTPVKKLRTPLTRTISSPAFSYGQPEYFGTPMSRRDSTSSFASSIDSWPMTPVNEEFVAPDMLYRSASHMGSGRPRSSTAGSMSLNCHPYYPGPPSAAARMQRRHTSMGSMDDVPKLHWSAMPSYSSYDHPQTPSQAAAYTAIHSASSTPMQHQLSSPLSEMGVGKMNRLNVQPDVLPLIVSSMDKAHVCPHCDKRFKRLEHVKRHERSHTQEKPFACSIDGCGRFFSRSDNLKAHEKTHYKKGRNYRLMLKKMGSAEHLEGTQRLSASPSDEGFGDADEYELHNHDQQQQSSSQQSQQQQPLSPDQYLSFTMGEHHDDIVKYEDTKNYEAFSVDDFTH